MKENEVDGTRGTHEVDKKCVQKFSRTAVTEIKLGDLGMDWGITLKRILRK
jgi:hypothetical protein